MACIHSTIVSCHSSKQVLSLHAICFCFFGLGRLPMTSKMRHMSLYCRILDNTANLFNSRFEEVGVKLCCKVDWYEMLAVFHYAIKNTILPMV